MAAVVTRHGATHGRLIATGAAEEVECGNGPMAGFGPKSKNRVKLSFARFYWSLDRIWLRGLDLNQRPLGYEPNELPDCSTPRQESDYGRESVRVSRAVREDVQISLRAR